MKSPFAQIVQTLLELKKQHPSYNLGRHISTALSDYGDPWNISDKEMLFALEKYKTELEIDLPHTETNEIEEIIKGGMNLHMAFEEEDDGSF